MADTIGLTVEVTGDYLEAYISTVGSVPEEVGLQQVKALIEAKGVRYGLIGDEEVAAWLAERPLSAKPFIVANGLPPASGIDETIHYKFDTDPLKIGIKDQSGIIDFKDRGQIPQVEKGVVLAEVVSGVDGNPGMDVFGRTIPGLKFKKAQLKLGAGAVRSEDGRSVLAGCDGRPWLSPDQRIFVFTNYVIDGDVGYETGHVEFDGHVEVKGLIRDGFNVTAGSLTAAEAQECVINR